MNRRQSLEKGILSPPGPFLTPSQSPSIQHSPRLQPSPSPSQSPFQTQQQQDVLIVTNNNQHYINTFTTTQEQDRKTGTPNRRLSLNHISPNATTGTIVYRPSPTQSPAGNEFNINTTLVGSNNISLNKKGKRTPNTVQYGTSSNVASPKTTKKTTGMAIAIGSPIASPSASPQPVIQQFPMMSSNNSSIVFMQQPATSHRTSIIQTSNTQQSNFIATTSTNSGKHNKTPQQILPKPTSSNMATSSSPSIPSQSLISTTTSTKQIVTQSKMAIVQQQTAQQFQSPPHHHHHHQNQQIIHASQAGSDSPSPQPQQITTQGGSILLPTNAQPLLLNQMQMPVLVQQNTPQGVQLILRPPSAPQLATPGLVIHNRPQMQQSQPQQLLRILNTNGSMQLATATAAPAAFIVSSQGNIIQQNHLQSIKATTNNSQQMGNQQASRQPQQIITANSHILGQSVAQIQNLQLNGNLTQIQMPNGQIIQQLPAQFSQNLGSFNQIQPITFQSPPQNNNAQSDIVSSTTSNSIQFGQGAQIISPVATPQPQIIQSSDPILSSPPSITFNSQPAGTTVIVSNDKQIHEMSSPPPFSIIQQNTAEMINIDMTHVQQQSQHQQQQAVISTPPKPARKPKKSKKKLALEQQQLEAAQAAAAAASAATAAQQAANDSAPTGKLDLANVMKLCGIMEDDDFMDGDEMGMEQSFESQHQQTIHIPANAGSASTNENNEITITIPGNTSSDQPITFTIPSSSLEGSTNADGSTTTIIQSDSSDNNKINDNVPFMIRFDGDGQGGSNQPFTISVPNLNVDDIGEDAIVSKSEDNNGAPGINCVPSFVNSVLNSSVTPTIQSQINEIQNQLMASVNVTGQQQQQQQPASTPAKPAKAPRQKKQTTKKSKKQLALEKQTIEVPTQIGNIQISQIDGTSLKNHTIENINNQIQIMPILDKAPLMEKQKMQLPIMQQTISHQQQHNSHGGGQHHQQHQGSHTNSSGPSQVNINVQQNQLINVTNNLQMQVIANPQHQHHHHHHSTATPAPPPPTSSSHHHHQTSSPAITSQPTTINAQNIIGNIINGNQSGGGGNIIIQGSPAFNQQQPANIQVNIQNQTIANNIIHTSAPAQNQQQQPQQPTAQSILSQLTGNLVLSLSEDGRLILRHDPNIPQDAQSQMILQTILTGALGNVSLINEPLKQQQQQQQQQQTVTQNQQTHHQPAPPTTTTTTHHVIGANGKVQQVTTVQNKNVIITSQGQATNHQQQQIFTMPATQTIVTQNHAHQQPQHQVNTTVAGNQQKPQAVVLPTPNIIKFVELPKIQPNQQLFSLNTLTNEITLLNPNQTTAALSPMERLLIVPSGINAQQLAQCLSQGQIHFNNIGEAPTTDPNKVQMQIQQQQMHVQQQHVTLKTMNLQQKSIQIKKEPVEVKPKKARGKKAKLLEEQQQQQLQQQMMIQKEIKKEPIQSPPPMKIISPPISTAVTHIDNTKIVKTMINATATLTTSSTTTKNTITISPNPTMIVNPTTKSITKCTASVTKVNNKNSISVIPTSTLLTNNQIIQNNNVVATTTTTTKVVTTMATAKTNNANNNKKTSQPTPPPLVSMNQAPRVQTIQLTPQKQQSLKNVQMQIQQLSGKLQNKSLLATLTADIDVNSAAFNKPLPTLNNINAMTDGEIYEALQRLFVEQQKILATGKIIQTIPAAVSPAGNQQTIRTLNNSQSIYVNNQGIVAPISSSTSGGNSLYGGGNSQKVPSPIQVNSPIVVKQESQLGSAVTSSSQPPPLVVSTPIQMQIKTEIMPSSNTSHIITPTTAPPATGSIIISPKYTTTPVKITIDPQYNKEPKVVPHVIEKVVEIVPKVNEIDTAALLKQQQAEALQKKKAARSSLFERQICVDQNGCTKADVKTDFTSKEDAVKRLIRYHCMHEEIKCEKDPKEEYEIEEKSKLYLASFQVMKEKFQHLLMKQSQKHAPTSELMMLDRLQVADLKDEIVSMQAEINSMNQENQPQESVAQIKTEPIQINNQTKNHQTPSSSYQQTQQQQRIFMPSMQEPSQILKAKQEQKLFENIKNERIKVENAEKESRKNFHPNNSANQTKVVSKFDKLKNDSNLQNHTPQQSSPVKQQQQQPPQPSSMKIITELKDELDDFDIESEIRSNFIMKKCEPTTSAASPVTAPTATAQISPNSSKKSAKAREREFSPFSDYLNSVKMDLAPSKSNNKSNDIKHELQDGTYDEWLSIQKELSLDLDSKRKDIDDHKHKSTKALDSDLSDIFDNPTSPKSVEKQLDDLFSSTTGEAESPSGLNELFQVESSAMSEKTVENRLEALFGDQIHDDQMKNSQQDLVETRLEQLFQGSVVNANDESALDSASFLYKNPDLTYDMIPGIQKQVPANQSAVSVVAAATTVNATSNVNANTSNSNKRQWNSSNSCDIFSSSNSSIVFPSSSSPTSSKRPCTASSVTFDDNKWIDDSFDFGSDINIPTETSNDGLKHREWNGAIDHTMLSTQQQQFPGNLHPSMQQTSQQQSQQLPINSILDQRNHHLMDTSQIPPLNYDDDVDDISRQVQNAIDSILNLQSSDPLHFDSSFLELNAITSSSPNSPMNHVQHHPQNIQSNSHHNQYSSTSTVHHQPQPQQQQQQSHHQFAVQNSKMMTSSSASNASGMTKQQQQRKYSRMDDIGDCLIGGSNLDDSPSALSLTLSDSHGETSSATSVGEFVNNLLNCDEKSISTS